MTTTASLHRVIGCLGALCVVMVHACTHGSPIERAIRARGGPLRSVIREVEVDVMVAFPGRWRARTAFMVPDRYALTVFTTGEPDHYLYDGRAAHTFIGTREISVDTEAGAPLASQARFIAVVNLDALLAPGVELAPLPDAELPADATSGLVIGFRDGARYRLGFDRRGLVVWAAGPLDLPPIGRGEVSARYDDFRRVGGLLVPFRTEYRLGTRRLAEERVLGMCVNDPGLEAGAFTTPSMIPRCEAPHRRAAFATFPRMPARRRVPVFPRASGRRTVSTGTGACRTTFSATLPISMCESPVRPAVAMTIESTPRAASAIR
jgi:hypothetical protein